VTLLPVGSHPFSEWRAEEKDEITLGLGVEASLP